MKDSDALTLSSEDLKTKLAHNLMAGLVVVFLIGLPISLLRWMSLGFQPLFVVHIIVATLTLACYLRKDKAGYRFYLFVIIALLSAMIVFGVLSFGLQSGAIVFSVFCSFIVAIGWGARWACTYAVTWCLFVMGTGYLHISGHLDFTVSANEYRDTFGAWVLSAVGSSIVIVLMLIVAKQGYEYLRALISKIERQKQEIQQLANVDSMTGFLCKRLSVPNLQQALDLAEQEQSKVAVVYIDINEFKQINDTYGHHSGDQVLIEFCDRLKSALRDVDTPFRVGGDEFLLILPNVESTQAVEKILDRMVQTWQQPIVTNNTELVVTGSIGVAMYPQHGDTPLALRTRADKAMYFAKSNSQAYYFSK